MIVIRRSPTPWSFPLAPEGGPQSQPDPASEGNQTATLRLRKLTRSPTMRDF